MKTIIVMTALLISFAAAAESIQCSTDMAAVVDQVAAQKSCYDASQVAEQCAFGSSIDSQIAGAAIEICMKDLTEMTAADGKMLSALDERCDQAYENQEGTLYISMNAFCHLDATKFFSNLYLNPEN